MADDRTPRTISLTQSPPEDDAESVRKHSGSSRRRRQIHLDPDVLAAREREISERNAEERRGPRLV